MEEFLQAYGTWIVFGLFFVLMLRMHAGGGGCGMGHDEHRDRQVPSDARRQPPTGAVATDETSSKETATPTVNRPGGCH